MCTVVTTYLEHPCGATVFSGRAHVRAPNYCRFPHPTRYRFLCRRIAAKTLVQAVSDTPDSTPVSLAQRRASSRKHWSLLYCSIRRVDLMAQWQHEANDQ